MAMFRICRVIAGAEAAKAPYLWPVPTMSEQRGMIVFRVNFPFVVHGVNNMISIRTPVNLTIRCR